MKMKQLVKTTILAMAALVLAIGAKAQDNETEDLDAKYATELLKKGAEAPAFSLPTPEGKTVSLADFKGQYVVLDFWASWCPDCRKDAPNIVALHKQYKDKGVAFVGISFDTNKEAWTNALPKLGIEYTQVSELQKMNTSAVAKAYAVKWIPSVYLIDPEGKVVIGTVVSEKIAAELAKVFPSCCEKAEKATCEKAEKTCCEKKEKAACGEKASYEKAEQASCGGSCCKNK